MQKQMQSQNARQDHDAAVLLTSRRDFLQGLGLVAAGLALHPLTASIRRQVNTTALAERKVVIYQDKAHFDDSGRLDAYVPPRNLSSRTRQYVQSLDTHTFASRHWFV
jgi:hypothetical protein